MTVEDYARGLRSETRYAVDHANGTYWRAFRGMDGLTPMYCVEAVEPYDHQYDMVTTTEHEAAEYMVAISENWTVTD
jgi:hypothetical protein